MTIQGTQTVPPTKQALHHLKFKRMTSRLAADSTDVQGAVPLVRARPLPPALVE